MFQGQIQKRKASEAKLWTRVCGDVKLVVLGHYVFCFFHSNGFLYFVVNLISLMVLAAILYNCTVMMQYRRQDKFHLQKEFQVFSLSRFI